MTGIRLWLGLAVRIGLEVTETKANVPKTPKHTYFEGLRVGYALWWRGPPPSASEVGVYGSLGLTTLQ